MKKKFKTIAIIPARSGSKGLPGKNIKLLLGKPLICWAIESALSSENIDLVLVSTDSEEIADISLNCGAEVPFIRPFNLASDEATTFSVVEHAIKFYSEEKKINFDLVALLEPTSPIRQDGDIDNMINILSASYDEKDAIVSLGEVPTHPSLLKIIDKDNSVIPYEISDSNNSRRQDLKKVYFPYGVGYISKIKVLLEEKTFYPKRTLGYVIGRHQNYEVDDIYDFICIEEILKFNHSKS